MRQYVRCCNRRCDYVGYLEGKELRGAAPSKIMKAKTERRGDAAAAITHLEFRCPKCGNRWRMRHVPTSSH